MSAETIFRGNRRLFLKNSARVFASAATVPLGGCASWQRKSPAVMRSVAEQKPQGETLEEIAEKIRRFEANIGERSPTKEEAQAYVPLVAELFVKSTQSRFTAKELTDSTYIVRGEPRKVSDTLVINLGDVPDPYSYAGVKRFQEDYPDVNVDQNLAQVIANMTSDGGVGAWYWNNKTFFILGDTQAPEVAGLYDMQYKGKGRVVDCEYPTPITSSRSRLLHEYTHADADRGWVPMEPEVFDMYIERTRKYWESQGTPLEPITAYKNAFMMVYDFPFPGTDTKWRLDRTGLGEFATDYLSTRISVDNNLSYDIGYGSPDSHSHFETVLQQARITTQELRTMYRNYQLKEFLLKAAEGALNISFESEADKLRFMLDKFDLFFSDPFFGPTSKYTPHYPYVAGGVYVYINPSMYDPNLNSATLGCRTK